MTAGVVVYGSARLFVWPSVDSVPAEADAVVVLAGGDGDRLPKGLELMRQGKAPVLVLSIGDARTQKRSAALCGRHQPYEVMCRTPRPATTRGEARLVARLSQERGWREVLVVTSLYHLRRSRLLLERCVAARVTMVASTPRAKPLVWSWRILHEWGGLAQALVLARSC